MVLVRARPPVFMRRICIKTDLGWALSRYLSESEQLIGLFGSLATHFTSRLKSSKKRHRLRRCCLFEFSSPLLPDSPSLSDSAAAAVFIPPFSLLAYSSLSLLLFFTFCFLLFFSLSFSSFHFYPLVPLSTYEILLYVGTERRFYCPFFFFPLHLSFSWNGGLTP